jgi:hypothetical protein
VLVSGIRQSSPVRRSSWRIFGGAQATFRLPPYATARFAVPTSAVRVPTSTASPTESMKLIWAKSATSG